MSNGNGTTEHNRAYEQLVSGDDDLIGLIAYALYKKDKRDFYLGWQEQHGSAPQADHVRAFTATVLTLGQQLRYRTGGRPATDRPNQTVADAKSRWIQNVAVTDASSGPPASRGIRPLVPADSCGHRGGLVFAACGRMSRRSARDIGPGSARKDEPTSTTRLSTSRVTLSTALQRIGIPHASAMRREGLCHG